MWDSAGLADASWKGMSGARPLLPRGPLRAGHWESEQIPCQQTPFYPPEDYRPEHLYDLSRLWGQGSGEIEVLLHHGYSTSASLLDRLKQGARNFNRHGVLITQGAHRIRTDNFIHRNLALTRYGKPHSFPLPNRS